MSTTARAILSPSQLREYVAIKKHLLQVRLFLHVFLMTLEGILNGFDQTRSGVPSC